MWPFSDNKKTSTGTPPEDLREKVQELETAVRLLRGEWEDTYERVMRALRRLNKRAQDQARQEEAAASETREDAPGATISGGPSLDPISAAIHARRSRAVPPGANGRG